MAVSAGPQVPAAVHARRWLVLAVLSGCLAVIALDNTIVNVALPRLQEDLGATTSELQWVVDAYSLLFAGTLLLAGSLGDRFGRRLTLLVGLVVFGVGSLLAGFAPNATWLTVWRAVMGVGGAFIMPSTLSILAQVFRDRTERAQAIGIWAAVAGAAVAVGPILGGLLLDWFDWHAIFLVNPILVVGMLIATVALVPESADPTKPRLDPLGAVLSTLGLVALVFTIIELPESGFDAVTIGGAVLAVALLWGFVAWERRAPRPLLPMEIFRTPLLTVSVGSVAIVYFALMGMMFFVPQFLQLVKGFDPLESGLAVLPLAGGLLVASLVSPGVAEKTGTRVVVVGGLLGVTVGMVLAGFLTAATPYVLLGLVLLLMGLGLGAALPQSTNGVLASVPVERAGMGSALNDGVSELGGSIGVAVLGAILSVSYRSSIDEAVARAGNAIEAVPSSVVEATRESLASAVLATADVDASVAGPVRQVAGDAFVTGMTTATLVGAAITLVGALLAWWLFPNRVARVEE